MPRPPHTDRQGLRAWLDQMRTLVTSLGSAADSSAAEAPEGDPRQIDMATVADLARAVAAHLDAFTDVWAHDCAAFDAIDLRVTALERAVGPEHVKRFRGLESQRPSNPGGDAASAAPPNS